MAGNDPLGLLGEAANGDPLGLLDAPVEEKPVGTFTEGDAKESPIPSDNIPTVTMDANDGLVPASAGEFDINNPTRANGVINVPKGGVTSVALQVEEDKIKQNQSEYVKNAKNEIRKLAINTDFSAPPVDPMVGQQQQSIDGNLPGNAVDAKVTDFERNLNYIINPENLPENQIQLSKEDKDDLAIFAQKAAQVAPAIQKYSKELEQKPDDVETLNKLAENLAFAGDTSGALSHFTKANSIQENGASLMGLGNVYLEAGDNENARNAFEDAYYKDKNPDALIKAAYAESALGNTASSLEMIDNIKEEFPNYSYGYALSAYNNEKLGDKSAAAVDNATYEILRQQELLPEALNATDPNSDYAKERASQYARLGAIHDAIAAPINFFGEMQMGTIKGGIEGLERIGKGMEAMLMQNNKVGAFLDILLGSAETFFSGAMLGVIPGPTGGVKAIGTNVAFHSLPEPVNKVLMEPLNILLNLTDEEVKEFSNNEAGMLALGNTLGSILFLGAVHGKNGALSKKEQEAIIHIIKGESIEGQSSSLKDIVKKAKDYLENSKLSSYQEAATVFRSMPADLPLQDKISVAPDLVARQKLQEEMAKASPAFKGYYAEKIRAIDENINAKLSGNKTESLVKEELPNLLENESVKEEMAYIEEEISSSKESDSKKGVLGRMLSSGNKYLKEKKEELALIKSDPIAYFEKKLKDEQDWAKENPEDAYPNTINRYKTILSELKGSEKKVEPTSKVEAIKKPTFENVPVFTRTPEEIEFAKNEVFNNLSKLEIGSVIENSDGEIKVVTENSIDKKGNQLIGVITYERQADGSLRQMTNIVWAEKKADGKIKLEYSPHLTATNSKGERVTVTDQITDKKIDLSKENIFAEDKDGNLIQVNKVEPKAEVKEVLMPEYSEKLKDVSPETKVTELPDGLSVEFNGEKGTIGRSETGETLFINEKGKETIVGGGGDVATLAEKGISRTEGTYSDKRGDYYVKDGRVFEIKDGKLKPVYEGEKANIERKEAIIRKALNPEKPKGKKVEPVVEEGPAEDVKTQIENFGVPKEDVEATHSLLGQIFDGLKKAGLTVAKTVGDWVGIGKGSEKPYSLKINGKDVKVDENYKVSVDGKVVYAADSPRDAQRFIDKNYPESNQDQNGGFKTRDGKPIGFKYDTDKVARERFDFSKLEKIGSGSDRDVYDLGNGRVLKVAKTARGLTQNIYEGDHYLTSVVPEVFERGQNYVVAEKMPRIKTTDVVETFDWDGNVIGKSTAGEMIKELKEFSQKHFDNHDSKLQDVLAKYGLQDIMNYDVLWGDFIAQRNWGYKEGKAYHSDGGTFGGVEMIASHKNKTNLSDPEFKKIYEESKKLKKEFGDTDKATMYKKEDGEIQAQYRIQSGKNIIEAIKNFAKSKNKSEATVAVTHEIMHPTVVSIIDGAKEGNEIGKKHTATIIEEYNKANPNDKITESELIQGNEDFKGGNTGDKYRAVQEFIAKAWEKYHTEGAKGFSAEFQKVLDQITKAFQAVYKSLKPDQITPELRKMFDEILGKEESMPSGKAKEKAGGVGVEGVAYTAETGGAKSKGVYLADEGVAKSYGEGGAPIVKYKYKFENPLIIEKDGDFDVVNKLIEDYQKENPDAKFHPDTTDHVNKELEKLGYDGLIIKKEALDSEKGYNEIGGTYGEPQIVVFDRKNISVEEAIKEAPKDELQFPAKEQWEIDRDAAKEHDKLFDEDEIRAAYEQRDQDLSQLGRGKDYVTQVIHDNFGGISLADWTRYGDVNWLKGKEGKAFKKKYIKEGDINLEQKLDDLADQYGVAIEMQDVIDYIIDRETNPKKYDGRLKQWNDAASIPKKDVSSILTGDDAMVAAIVESNRGLGMTDLEADTIKRYVESKAKNEARAKNTKSGSAEGAPKSAGPIAKSERVGRKPSEKAQKKKDEAKSVKAEENKYAKAEEKITKIFDVLREKAKNNPLLKDYSPEGTKKGGSGMEDLINAAEKVIITAIRAGEKIDVAISKGIEHLREEWKKTFDSEFPEKELRDILNEGADGEIQLVHKKTEVMREELGMDPREQREPVSIEQTKTEAKKLIKKGYNVPKLIDELLKKERSATPVERAILTEFVAVKDKAFREMDINDPLWGEKKAELQKAIDAADTAGSASGSNLGAMAHLSMEVDNSLIGYIMEDQRVNKNAELTKKQKETSKAEFEAINKAKTAYEKRIAKLEEENNRLKAEKAVEKLAKKASKKVAKEKLDEDFDALAKEFSSISRNTLSASGPLQATGIILKMAKNRIDKGIITLSEVVDSVHEKLGQFGVSKEDIINAIASKSGVERKRSQAAADLYTLKQEAKLVQKLADLQNGKEPVSERGKIKKNQRLEELRQQIKEHDLTKLSEYKKRLEEQIAEVEQELATGDFAVDEKPIATKMDPETLALKHKYDQLRMEREARLLKAEYEQRSASQKARDVGMSLLNAPMTLMSSGDVSAVLRQGLVASTSHPILAARASKQMLKFFKSQKDFDRWHFETKNDPRYLAAKEAGLAIVDPQNPKLAAREEAFMGNIVEKIPLYGKGIKLAKIKDGKLVRTEGEYGGLVKASERAYVGFLNKMRWDVYNLLSERLKDQGITFENNPTLYKELASHVNNITGRGNIPKNMERLSPALNAAFFSPRLWASRLNLLSNFMNPLWYKKVPKEVRRFYWEDMGKFAATATIAYLMAGAGGSDVETDIRSSDFLKIRNGKKRYDILGGFQQPIRTLGQYFSGESKNIETGEIKELSDPDLPIYDRLLQKSRLKPVVQHIRGKLSPVPAAVYDMAIEGKMMDQQTPTLWKEAKRMMVPLAWQDIVSAYGEEGAKSFVTTALPTLLGVSNSIYKDPEPEPKEKPKPVKKKKKRGVFE